MIFSTAVVASVLSLLTLTGAATIDTRGDDCKFVCPANDLDGSPLLTSSTRDGIISCSYYAQPTKWCKYDWSSGVFVGNEKCPDHATKQCAKRKGRELKQAVARRGIHGEDWDKDGDGVEWGRRGYASPDHKRGEPTPTPYWPSSTPTPYPSPPSWSSPYPWSSSYPQPKPSSKPCDFRCPQQDLAKNQLTDEAFRDPFLFCSYSTPHCKTCSFCKYDMDTGKLLEDNDNGYCPQTASASRPWDRRFV